MAGSIVLDNKKFSIYIKFLGGLADGPLIWIDGNGLHHGPSDPLRLSERQKAAVQQISAGIEALQAAVPQKAPVHA